MEKITGDFEGFYPETQEFLLGIRANNQKTWFEAHKSDYENYVVAPLKALSSALTDPMEAIDPHFAIGPRSVSRIYRDARFSADKSPYKTSMWVSFKRPSKEWTTAPAYYFEITPDDYRYGMGFYAATPDAMRRFRESIDASPQKFKKVVAFFEKGTWELEGDFYKKTFDSGKPPEINRWYQRKSFYLVRNRKPDKTLLSPKLAEEMTDAFIELAPLYHYLMSVVKG